MDRWRGRTALVTGASKGIGAAISKKLVNCGIKVIGCARGIEGLKALAAELAGGPDSFVPIVCDLEKDDDIMAMFSKIKSEHGHVDICINNAGYWNRGGSILNGETEVWRTTLGVNVLAVALCTRESVKLMRENNIDDGHIIIMNSMSGHRVANFSLGHMYCAAKYGVTALTEGIRQELREIKSQIRVTSISPGMVDTEMVQTLKALKNVTYKILEPDDIADNVIHVLASPPHVQIHEILIHAVDQMN